MPEIYPWNILEMSVECIDERSIRRAYARKLKKCRPDEDPEGFQILLQARNHALLHLKDKESADTAASFPTARFQSISVQTDGDEAVSVQGDNSKAALSNLGSDFAPDFGGGADHGQEAFFRGYFEKKLEEMNDPVLNIWELPYWHDFFDALNSTGFHCRQDVEWLLIRQVGCRLFENSHTKASQVSPDRLEQESVQAVLSLLDEEFGWSENDQKVYKVLGHSDGDLFLTLIRSASSQKSREGIEARHLPAIPYIAIPDLRAFTGDRGEDIVQYYIAACQSGQWGQGMDWSGFLFSYIWHSWHSLWKASLAIILLQIGIIALMVSVGEFRPLLYGMVAGVLAVLPLLYIARYGKYHVVHFAIKLFKESENIPIGNSLERFHYLKDKGRGTVFFTPFMVSIPFAMVYMIYVLKG